MTQFVKNNFTNVHFKRKWSKNKDYKIMTSYKNTEKEKNFINIIRVDSKPKYKYLDIDIPLSQYIRETLDYLKDMKELCVDTEVDSVLYSLMEANGEYPEYDIEYLETFDIEVLVDYSWSYNYKHYTDDEYSWHFFVYDIKKGDYPLERLPSHVRDILKERYYG